MPPFGEPAEHTMRWSATFFHSLELAMKKLTSYFEVPASTPAFVLGGKTTEPGEKFRLGRSSRLLQDRCRRHGFDIEGGGEQRLGIFMLWLAK